MHSEADYPVRIGDVLAGKYRVERILGEGGMGVVVAAMHLQLEQLVAIKLVLPSMLKSATVVERFLREARAAVRLKSAHVAKVLDVGMLDSGAPFMTMEYLEGADLGQVLERSGPLPVDYACEYIVQACEAVAEAHSLGIVHRDIKPQNLFLTQGIGGGAMVKVLDFGISKVASEAASGLTQSQVTIGSPLYMAPEQMRSARTVDGRADIWAIGVVLFKFLTTRVPFEAETMPELCFKVVNDPPLSLRELRPDVPEGLEAVVFRCLEKSPERRFADVGELAWALEAYAPPSAHATIERARSVIGGARASLTSAAAAAYPPSPHGGTPPRSPSQPSHPSFHPSRTPPRSPSQPSNPSFRPSQTPPGYPSFHPSQTPPGYPSFHPSQTPPGVGPMGQQATNPSQNTQLIPTMSSWGNTRGERGSRARSIVAVAAIAFVALAVLVIFGIRTANQGAAGAATQASPPPSAPPSSAPSATAQAVVPIPTAPASVASVEVTSAPAVDANHPGPSKPTPPATKPTTKPTPTPGHPDDDIPSIR